MEHTTSLCYAYGWVMSCTRVTVIAPTFVEKLEVPRLSFDIVNCLSVTSVKTYDVCRLASALSLVYLLCSWAEGSPPELGLQGLCLWVSPSFACFYGDLW